MKLYNLQRIQILPISLMEAWQFFSTPQNLAKITPDHMKFDIQYLSGGNKMYAGQIIQYKINVLPKISIRWTTEITHVQEPHYFVDEQRFGPYAMWHHQHHFKEIKEGVEMLDEVNYALPLGLIGRAANAIFVKKQVNTIFDYRYKILADFFHNGYQI